MYPIMKLWLCYNTLMINFFFPLAEDPVPQPVLQSSVEPVWGSVLQTVCWWDQTQAAHWVRQMVQGVFHRRLGHWITARKQKGTTSRYLEISCIHVYIHVHVHVCVNYFFASLWMCLYSLYYSEPAPISQALFTCTLLCVHFVCFVSWNQPEQADGKF